MRVINTNSKFKKKEITKLSFYINYKKKIERERRFFKLFQFIFIYIV